MKGYWPSGRFFLGLFILGFLIYSNTFSSGFVCDDPVVITQNPAIRHLDLAVLWHAFNTRFIVGLSLALNYALGKENVLGYHLFNTLVHIVNSLLVYQLVRLTPPFPPSLNKEGGHRGELAFLTALVFLTHPIQTQGVTYIWQRATSLATFFYLGALVFYIRARLVYGRPGGSPLHGPLYFGLCLVFTVLGMFTKEIVFTLPFMILLYELMFLKGLSGPKIGRVTLLAPIFLTLLIIPWAMTKTGDQTLSLLRPKNTSLRHQENFIKGVFEMTRALDKNQISRKEYVLTEMNVLRTYLRLFIFPVRQSVDYDYPVSRSLNEPKTLLSCFLLFSLLGSAFLLLKKHPLIAFGIFWFFLTASVESLVVTEEFILEHRLYLPMIGLSLSVVAGLGRLFEKNPRRLMVLLLGAAACLSFLTYQRNFVWKNEWTLWNDAAGKFPNKARIYKNRGSAYGLNGDFERALKDLNKAIELKPDYASAYFIRGSIYQKKGLLDQALSDFNKAIELQPNLAPAHHNREILYAARAQSPGLKETSG